MSGCGKDHRYLIHPGENVDGNSAETTPHNTFESGASTSNMRQPVTKHQSNQARTIVDTVNPITFPPVSESTRASCNSPVAVCSVRAIRPRVCFKVIAVKISCKRWYQTDYHLCILGWWVRCNVLSRKSGPGVRLKGENTYELYDCQS